MNYAMPKLSRTKGSYLLLACADERRGQGQGRVCPAPLHPGIRPHTLACAVNVSPDLLITRLVSVNTDVRACLFADQGCVPAAEGQCLAVSGLTILERMSRGVHV